MAARRKAGTVAEGLPPAIGGAEAAPAPAPEQDPREGLPQGVRVTSVEVHYGGKLPLDQRYSMAEVGATLRADVDTAYASPEEALAVLRELARSSVREQTAGLRGVDTAAAALLTAAPSLRSGDPPATVAVALPGGGYAAYGLLEHMAPKEAQQLLASGQVPQDRAAARAAAYLEDAADRATQPLGRLLEQAPWLADGAALLLYQYVLTLVEALDEEGAADNLVPGEIETYGLTRGQVAGVLEALGGGRLTADTDAGRPYLWSWLRDYEERQERKRQQDEDALGDLAYDAARERGR